MQQYATLASPSYAELESLRAARARARRRLTLLLVTARLRGMCADCRAGNHCESGECSCCSGDGWER